MLDVLLHVAGAVLMVALGAFLGHWLCAALVIGVWCGSVFSALFWPIRELFQARAKFGRWVMPWHPWWSGQRSLEAFVPAAVSLALALIATLIL